MSEKDITNLASKFDEKELNRLGQECFELYKKDDESRSKWLDLHKTYLEIYHQTDNYDNNFPDEFNGSGARVPLLTEACLSFQARAYKAIFPQRSFVATSSLVNTSKEEQERADRIAAWMNNLLNFRIRRYKRDKKRMLLAVALMGSDFSKTYHDPLTNLPKIERVRAQDLIVNYDLGPREIEDVRRKTHRIPSLDMNKARMLFESGYFNKMPVPSGIEYTTGNDMQSIEDEAEGILQQEPEKRTACILEQHTYYDLDGDKIEEPVIITIDETSQKVLRISARYNVEDSQKRPLEHFTHYTFIDNPDGFYGFGYGHLIGRLNQSTNQMLCNAVNAAELANAGNMGGFISDNIGIKGGEVELPLGKFIKVPRTADDLNKGIKQMNFPGPNAAYVQLMEFMQTTIQRLSNTTEAVSGDVSKVYQPMTILTMLEQSLQMPTSIMENIALCIESELEKILKVAREHAEIIESFVDNDKQNSITYEDFQGATRIYPIMDPRSISKQQKMAKAQSVYQLAGTNPLIAQRPDSMYVVTKQVLEAMEVEDIDLILPKPQNQEPQRIDDQHMENMFFLLPAQDRPYFDVFPEQNHQEHLRIIDELLKGFAQHQEITQQQDITEESLQAIMLHRQKHIAYLYGQQTGVINGQGQLGNMEAPAGDAALLDALMQQLQMGAEPSDMSFGESGEIPGTGRSAGGSEEVSGEGILGRIPVNSEG